MTLPAIAAALYLAAVPTVAEAPVAVVPIPLIAEDGSITAGEPAPILLHTEPPLPQADEPSVGAEATVTVSADAEAKRHQPHAKGDPFEHFNRRMFAAHEKFDRSVLRPTAMGYKHAVPKPVRRGLHNFFSNLGEPIVFLNDLLQLKPGRAVATFGRFAFNTVLGFGGLFNIANTPGFHLPHRPNGFGDTLGYYGVKPGPYLFLPFVGPTDLRDLFGGQADGLVLPLAVGTPFNKLYYQIPKGVITGLDQRAEADDDLRALFSSAVDPYATLRSVYLQDRAGEIAGLKGKRARVSAPGDELDDPLADPAAASPAPAPSVAPELSDPLTDPAASPAPSTAPELSDPLSDPAAAPAGN